MANTTTIEWNALVDAIDNQSGLEKKDVAYRFSNGREFYRAADVYGWTNTGFPYQFPFFFPEE